MLPPWPGESVIHLKGWAGILEGFPFFFFLLKIFSEGNFIFKCNMHPASVQIVSA